MKCHFYCRVNNLFVIYLVLCTDFTLSSKENGVCWYIFCLLLHFISFHCVLPLLILLKFLIFVKYLNPYLLSPEPGISLCTVSEHFVIQTCCSLKLGTLMLGPLNRSPAQEPADFKSTFRICLVGCRLVPNFLLIQLFR